MYFPTREAVTSLNRALCLHTTGREQDWDIELANPDRVVEFIAHLEHCPLNDNEKRALMALILASVEDLSYKEEPVVSVWTKIKRVIEENRALYDDVLAKWKPKDDDLDGFLISPLIGFL